MPDTFPISVRTAVAALALCALAPAARGDYLLSLDPGADPSTGWSGSALAESRFLGEVAGARLTTIDFDGLPAGQAADGTPFALTGDGSVVATTTNTDHAPPPGFGYGVVSLPNSDAAENNRSYGFNTSGAGHFVFAARAGVTSAAFSLHSDQPFNAFGFYLTGLGNVAAGGTLHVLFHDVTDHDVLVEGAPDGGALYFSYVGTGAPITDLRLEQSGITKGSRDVFGIDGITLASVPEPPSWALTGLALGAALGARALAGRRRRD